MLISLAVRSSPIIFSNMGSTLSKKLNDRGRKQRSAAERLVDSRKQGENQFFSTLFEIQNFELLL